MRKKGMMLTLAILLLLHGMFGSGWGIVHAQNADDVVGGAPGAGATVTDTVYGDDLLRSGQLFNTQSTESILTRVSIQDNNGTVIDSVYNPGVGRIELGMDTVLIFEWELPNNHGYTNGSTFEFDIPAEFKLYTPFTGTLVTDGPDDVGTFSVSVDGRVVMTFNEHVDNSEVRGMVQIQTELSKESVKGDVDVPITFPVRGGSQVAVLKVKPTGGSLIAKNGEVAKDAAGRPSTINWTIDVNTKLETIEGAVIADPVPAGLTLEPGSIKVYNLQVNVDGSAVPKDQVTTGFTVDSDPTGFEISFDSAVSTAYRIVYSTTIGKGDEANFHNIATLSGDNIADAIGDANVPVDRGEILTKQAGLYNEELRTIDWEISYNFRGKEIPQQDARLEDRFDASQELVNGSLVVEDAATGTILSENTDYELNLVAAVDGKHGFDLQFKRDVDSAYVITYQTQASDRVIEDITVTNSVYANNVTRTARQEMKSLVLVKERGHVDYNAKTVSWTIRINQDRKIMDNVVLTDTFTRAGLELLPDTVRLNGQEMDPAEVDFDPIDDDVKKGFVLSFHNPIDSEYVLTYTTAFNYDDLSSGGSFRNHADITWEVAGANKAAARTIDFSPDALTRNNGDKNGRYDATTKEITWTIRANYNKKPVAAPVITDQLLHNQKFKEDSLRVYRMILTGSANGTERGDEIDSSQYTFTPPSASNGNELRLEFAGAVDYPFQIVFSTTLDGEVTEKQISNQAVFLNGANPLHRWNSQAEIPQGGEYVAKTGTQNGEKIEWEVYINRGQSYVEEAKIVDMPSSNLVLVEDSFQLYETEVRADGSIIKTGTTLERDQDYELTFIYGDAESFELSFLQPIERPFILEYETLIDAKDRDKVSNTVSFMGSGITAGETDAVEEFEVRLSSGSGSGSGVRADLEILKVDSEDSSIVLEGATFVLKDAAGLRPDVELTTDAEGKALFTKLRYGDYMMKETIAPDGYTLDVNELLIKIDADVRNTGGVKKITITNAKVSVPEEPGTDPEEPGTDPEEPGTDPGTPGTNPSTPGTTPDTPGTNPSTPGTTPDTPGTNPSTPGTTPDTPDTNPSTPGTTPNTPGTDPSTPGTTPDTPEMDEGAADGTDEALLPGSETNDLGGGLATDNQATGQKASEGGMAAEGNNPPMLPKTGERSPLPLQLAGFALIIAGLFLRRLRLKRS
ncbi:MULTISPECIES: collagen binding domain-containing protein [Paenibacillus]|uniref:LPXTG cell wall anchor domain-containing protein n=1 Tax=Paenibacillus campinasensis TaxID=66347 RepID=A0ABW9T3Z2_9BACL|nr:MULTISPECIES: collagen binding domain-containing protein [Paenibacillus]MUG67814.1 LPXTG cell wall anchor domain-containing protein [Paenibacillus campinasensis]PAK48612.1 hypothetical protein CHH75_22530 [Paenibacillus sp. 7541]